MAGTNMKTKGRRRLAGLFFKYLIQSAPSVQNKNRLGRPKRTRLPWIMAKSGVPASNTAADAPDRAGQFCIDLTNKDVYHCTAFTNSTAFTWLKISD